MRLGHGRRELSRSGCVTDRDQTELTVSLPRGQLAERYRNADIRSVGLKVGHDILLDDQSGALQSRLRIAHDREHSRVSVHVCVSAQFIAQGSLHRRDVPASIDFAPGAAAQSPDSMLAAVPGPLSRLLPPHAVNSEQLCSYETEGARRRSIVQHRRSAVTALDLHSERRSQGPSLPLPPAQTIHSSGENLWSYSRWCPNSQLHARAKAESGVRCRW